MKRRRCSMSYRNGDAEPGVRYPPLLHQCPTYVGRVVLNGEASELAAPPSKTVMPPPAKAIPKSIPETINRTDRPPVKYPIGPTIVERTQRIRIQRGNFFPFQEPTASK